MAGSASNWFKPSAGPLKGQALYLDAKTRGMFVMPDGSVPSGAALINEINKSNHAIIGHLAKNLPRPPRGAAIRKEDALLHRPGDAAALADPTKAVRFDGTGAAGLTLNGVSMDPVSPDSWKTHTERDLPEPPLPKGAKRYATGVIVVEPDGRVWVAAPSMGYAGYRNTFAGGGIEKGMSPQQSARKEAREELGLDVEIMGWAGDEDNKPWDYRRYYVARRVGGAPGDAHYETDNVKLIPPDQAHQFLNKGLDRSLLKKLATYQKTFGTVGRQTKVYKPPSRGKALMTAKVSKAAPKPPPKKKPPYGAGNTSPARGGTPPARSQAAQQQSLPSMGGQQSRGGGQQSRGGGQQSRGGPPPRKPLTAAQRKAEIGSVSGQLTRVKDQIKKLDSAYTRFKSNPTPGATGAMIETRMKQGLADAKKIADGLRRRLDDLTNPRKGS